MPALTLAAAAAALLAATGADAYAGLSTFYSGIGGPIGACGVPPDKLAGKPFVALNDNSLYAGGKNCGRWISIKLGDNCEGGSNSASSVCNGGSYKADKHTGKTIYGYVADKCPDNNYWCQQDTAHLDIHKDVLDSESMTSGWNGRKVTWEFMSSAPSGQGSGGPKFMFKDGSKWLPNGRGFWASMVIYDVDAGVGRVQQKVGGSWQDLDFMNDLGQQFILKQPAEYRNYNSRSFEIRVSDASGTQYGTYSVGWPCGDSPCGDYTEAK